MLKRTAIKFNNIGLTAFVLNMTDLTLKLFNHFIFTMKTLISCNIFFYIFMTIQTKLILSCLFKDAVAVFTFLL